MAAGTESEAAHAHDHEDARQLARVEEVLQAVDPLDAVAVDGRDGD